MLLEIPIRALLVGETTLLLEDALPLIEVHRPDDWLRLGTVAQQVPPFDGFRSLETAACAFLCRPVRNKSVMGKWRWALSERMQAKVAGRPNWQEIAHGPLIDFLDQADALHLSLMDWLIDLGRKGGYVVEGPMLAPAGHTKMTVPYSIIPTARSGLILAPA
jgi:hypothetical protein